MLLNNPQTRYEEFYKIYEQSFPSIERRTKEGQKAVLEDADYRVRVVEEDGKILAFLGYWELPHCLFLEHLATTKASRGKGHGKKLVQECLKDTKKPVFLEIEPIIEEDPFIYEQMPLKPEDKPMELWIMSYGSTISEEDFLPYKKEIYHSVYKKEI